MTSWAPLPRILYGCARHSFEPSGDHEVPVEIGDEVYCFEVYQPLGTGASPWYRGYVVSTSPRVTVGSTLNQMIEVENLPNRPWGTSAMSVAEEPQVFTGIFPASCIHIREQLDDAEHRLNRLFGSDVTVNVPLDRTVQDSGSGLQIVAAKSSSDDQDIKTITVDDLPRNSGMNYRLSFVEGQGQGRRKSANMSSMAGFSRQLPPQQQEAYVSRLSRSRAHTENEGKPAPPLPNLKCSDETVAGDTEPLADEIASALREWASLLYLHLHYRDYELVNRVKHHIDALYLARRHLISTALAPDESFALRRDAVQRLVQGNVEQGLDVVVRHPASGALVDIDVDGDIDLSSWVSAVRMYVMQTSLSYAGVLPDTSLNTLTQADILPVFSVDAHLARASSTIAKEMGTIEPGPSSMTAPQALCAHMLLSVDKFVPQRKQVGGLFTEAYFSLFSKDEARYISEEFSVVVDSNGQSVPGTSTSLLSSEKHKIRTLFTELALNEVESEVYLVCRLVRTSSASEPTPSSFAVEDSPIRRPLGCAVVNVSDAFQHPLGSVSDAPTFEMSVFEPANESLFSTLHESLILGHTKAFQPSSTWSTMDVSVSVFHGMLDDLLTRTPVLRSVPCTERLGFSATASQIRSEVYVKLWSGDFPSLIAGANHSHWASGSRHQSSSSIQNVAPEANVQLSCQVRTRDGTAVSGIISLAAGRVKMNAFHSLVFNNNTAPLWGELFKIDIPSILSQCHLFFSVSNKNLHSSSPSRPFAFGYLPLFASDAFIPDGSHTLALYRYEPQAVQPGCYLQAPSIVRAGQVPALGAGLQRLITPLKDNVVVRTFLVSSSHTQNEVLLALLRLGSAPHLADLDTLRDVLGRLAQCPPLEIARLIEPLMDALLNILEHGTSRIVDDLVFQSLTSVISLVVSNSKYFSFANEIDDYIDNKMSHIGLAGRIVSPMHRCLVDPAVSEQSTLLQQTAKVWHYLLRIAIKSHEVEFPGALEGDSPHEPSERLRADLATTLEAVVELMSRSSPTAIDTQAAIMQHFPQALGELVLAFSAYELAEIVVHFFEAALASPNADEHVYDRLLMLNALANSNVYKLLMTRSALIPYIVQWLRPTLSVYEEVEQQIPDPYADDADTSPSSVLPFLQDPHVIWLTQTRLAVGVFGALLDVIHEALVQMGLDSDLAGLGQEQANLDQLMTLLPNLLDAYVDLDNPLHEEAVLKYEQLAVVPQIPTILPSTFPFPLLAQDPTDTGNGEIEPRASLRIGVTDVAAVILVLLHVASRKVMLSCLDALLEAHGPETLSALLCQLCRVLTSMLDHAAFPGSWINLSVLAHRVVAKAIEPLSDVLLSHFLKPLPFDVTPLWRDYFDLVLSLLASQQLVVEDFSFQKRRVVWRLAGDIRSEVAFVLPRMWEKLAAVNPSILSSLISDVVVGKTLELCLTHHDELRGAAVEVMHSMIFTEFQKTGNFKAIETSVIERLDKLFLHQTKGDDISRAFFVGQLRSLFETNPLSTPVLLEQVDTFLSSVSAFLELLLAVKSLPNGPEYQDDRIITTLRLMSFIRAIGHTEAYVKFVHRLVAHHDAHAAYTEAGLTLKLHADLLEWDPTLQLVANPDIGLPAQTHFARKEALYMRILDYLTKGKAYEEALNLCKDLQQQYQLVTFNYPRLAELFFLQGEIVLSIGKADARFPPLFRVAFFGTKFPRSVTGKQFVYRGSSSSDSYESFSKRMLELHPQATLIQDADIPPQEIIEADAQYLQITQVEAEPEEDDAKAAVILSNPSVPPFVQAYFEQCGTRVFSFTRDLSERENDSPLRWSEKTVLICDDAFPTVLSRTQVVEMRVFELSPIENALKYLQHKTLSLSRVEYQYQQHRLSQTLPESVDTKVLALALNEAVEFSEESPIPVFRKEFCNTAYRLNNPNDATFIESFSSMLQSYASLIYRCLAIHALFCSNEMHQFHDALEAAFVKNFQPESNLFPQEFAEDPLGYWDAVTTEERAASEKTRQGSVSRSSEAPGLTSEAHSANVSFNRTIPTPNDNTEPFFVLPNDLSSLQSADIEGNTAQSINRPWHAVKAHPLRASGSPLSKLPPISSVEDNAEAHIVDASAISTPSKSSVLNSHGSLKSSHRLSIHDSPPVIRAPPSKGQRASLGRNMTLFGQI